MKAVALVKISPSSLREALRPSGGGDLPDPVDRGGGLTFRMRDLDDATLLTLSTPFDAEADDITEAVKKSVGGVIRMHNDSRGVFVFPDRAMPSASNYAGVIDEVGELGEWHSLTVKPKPTVKVNVAPTAAPQPAKPAQPAMPDLGGLDLGALAAQMQQMMSAIPPEALAQMQQSVMSGDPSQMQAMEAQLQAMLGADKLAELQQQVLGAFANAGGEAPGEMPSEEQMEAMLAQAQAQMEELQKTNPALYEQMKKQMEGMGAEEPPKKK
jgi:hypothetical protein